jgi:hypothetical protein
VLTPVLLAAFLLSALLPTVAHAPRRGRAGSTVGPRRHRGNPTRGDLFTGTAFTMDLGWTAR